MHLQGEVDKSTGTRCRLRRLEGMTSFSAKRMKKRLKEGEDSRQLQMRSRRPNFNGFYIRRRLQKMSKGSVYFHEKMTKRNMVGTKLRDVPDARRR